MVMDRQDLERLSAAVDGELGQDLNRLLGDKRHDEEFQDHWFAFHLIGDVLRDANIPQTKVHAQVAEALKKEPVYLLPTGTLKPTDMPVSSTNGWRWLAVAAAVSMVILSTAVLRPDNAPVMQLAQSSTTALSTPVDRDLQTYVALHRQGSPLSEFQTVDYTPGSERN